MNTRAATYLEAFHSGQPFPSGLAFARALAETRLDDSLDSLDRVDYLLDQVRRRLRPTRDVFLESHQHQNFLYLLCFHVGRVISSVSGRQVVWLTYAEMVDLAPGNRTRFPRAFETSATCITKKGLYVPFTAIVERLFAERPRKSVRVSVEGFV